MFIHLSNQLLLNFAASSFKTAKFIYPVDNGRQHRIREQLRPFRELVVRRYLTLSLSLRADRAHNNSPDWLLVKVT